MENAQNNKHAIDIPAQKKVLIGQRGGMMPMADSTDIHQWIAWAINVELTAKIKCGIQHIHQTQSQQLQLKTK